MAKGVLRTCVLATVLLTAAVAVYGCRTAPRMDLPSVAPARTMMMEVPSSQQASVALGRVVVGVRRGTTIAHFPRSPITIGSRLCNYGHRQGETLEWGSGSREFGNWELEFGDIFFDVLSERGINVVGDSRDLFKQADGAQSAEYLIGGRIVDIRGNLCEWFDGWNGRPLDLHTGEFFITVEWSVFSTLADQTVARFRTSARYEQKVAKKDGINLAFSGAFARAAGNLATVPEFRRLLAGETPPPTHARTSGDTSGSKGGRNPDAAGPTPAPELISFPRIPPWALPIERNVGQILSSVVTIRIGGVHGSGFLVARSGHLLTNRHVVGSAENVQVVFANGLEVAGKVLRRDGTNDVALVQIPLRARSVLPIREDMVGPLEEVYAVGSPMDETLQATITKGVVSAIRMDPRSGIRLIQADVPVSPGNSGGPLLDAQGNVVGLTVAVYADARAQALNFFIPIQDALDALGIELGSDRTSMRK